MVFLFLFCRKSHSLKAPLAKSDMLSLSRKQFSDETMKKVHWVRHMYVNWCNYRNSQPHLHSFECDIESVETITKENSTDALCRFITEVKKVDARTM